MNTQDIPKPREATSVAMRMGAFPLRNSNENRQYTNHYFSTNIWWTYSKYLQRFTVPLLNIIVPNLQRCYSKSSIWTISSRGHNPVNWGWWDASIKYKAFHQSFHKGLVTIPTWQHPVSFRLTLVTMDTHSRPSEEKQLSALWISCVVCLARVVLHRKSLRGI